MMSASAARSSACASGVFRLVGWETGKPRASAACLTALGVSFMPRPACRSGWVSTRAIWCPASASAFRAAAANGGVPAKMRRTVGRLERCADRRSVGPVFACLLQKLGFDAVALETGQVIDKHLAQQMIQLMLDAHGQQAVGLQFERLAVAVEC